MSSINWILLLAALLGVKNESAVDVPSSRDSIVQTETKNFSSQRNVCSIIANAGPDLTVCSPGGNVQLQGSFNGNAFSYEWMPPTGLSDPFSLTPTAFVTATTTYSLTVFEIDPNAPNLVVNGDFSAGNVGFSSDYVFVPDGPGNMELWPEGIYSITNNSSSVHPNFAPCPDHSGGGNMMVVNGSSALQSVWCQTVNINPNTTYNFSAWVTSVEPTSPAQLQFSFNGTPVGAVVNASSVTCNWIPFNAVWNSGGATTAEICIVNLNTATSGNDFAIDDILFTEVCEDTDEMTVFVVDVEATIAPPQLIDCNTMNECQLLDATGSTTGPNVSYQWVASGPGTIVSGANTLMPFVCGQGTYDLIVSLTDNGTTCTATASVTVNPNNALPPPPTINGEEFPCPNQGPFQYCVDEEDAYETYFWDVPPGVNILSGQGTSCVIVDFTGGDLGDICIVVENYCGIPNTDCLSFDLQPLPSGQEVVGDTIVCGSEEQYTALFFDPLNATLNWSIPGDAVLISGQGSNVININWEGSNGGAVCVETTEPCGATTVCVNVLVLQPDTLFRDTSICIGDSIFLAGAFQNTAGVYQDSIPTTSGCDTVLITTLAILQPTTTTIPATTCDIDSVGTDTLFLTNAAFCDSLVITIRTYVGSPPINTSASSCNPLDTGLMVINHLNQFGCDSIENLYIALLPTTIETQMETTCDLSLAGSDTTTYANQFFCDSTVILITEFIPSDTFYTTVPTCDSTSIGRDTIVTAIPNACFEVEIRETIYVGSDPIFTNSSSCFPVDTGWITINHLNQFGCDSVEFNYTALLPFTQKDSLSFTCVATEAGVDTLILQNQYNCDSLLIITIEFVDSDTVYSSMASCDLLEVGFDTLTTPVQGGCFLIEVVETYFEGIAPTYTFAESCFPQDTGLLMINHLTAAGCDSLEILYTSLLNTTESDSTNYTCDALEVGVDTLYLQNQYNCDSLLIITTLFVSSDTILISMPTCNLLEVGLDTVVVPVQGGCFQVEIVDTYFAGVDPVYTFAESCFPVDTGFVTIPHQSIGGCDSLEILYTSLVLGSQKDSLQFTCVTTEAGIDTVLLQNQNNCDSLLIITTQFVSSDTLYATTPVCDSLNVGVDTVTTVVNGGCFQVEIISSVYAGSDPVFSFSESCNPQDTGLLLIAHLNQNGCDSLEYLYTRLLDFSQQDSMQFTCVTNEAGIDTVVLSNQNNCDSLLIITTMFVDSDTTYSFVPTCDSLSIGTDTVATVINGGCFLIEIITTYYVGSPPVFTSGISCFPQDSGLFTILHQNQYGCDSLEYFRVTYVGSPMDTLLLQTCTLADAGMDTLLFTNQYGCDSTTIRITELVASDTVYSSVPTCDSTAVGIFVTAVDVNTFCPEIRIIERFYAGSDPVFTFAQSCNPLDTGLQVITHSNQWFCDSIEYYQVDLAESSIEFETGFTCDITQSGVDTFFFLNQYNCDSLWVVITDFVPSDTLRFSNPTCDSSLVGIDTIVRAISGACFEVSITETFYVGSNPIYNFATTCNPLDSGLQLINHVNQFGCDSFEFLQIDLLPSNLINLDAATCEETQVGMDTIYLINQFGCDSIVITNTILLEPNLCSIEAQVFPDHITCLETEGAFSLEVVLGEAPFNYQWEGPGLNPLGNGTIDELNESVLIDGLVAGTYNITVTSAGGLVSILQVEITEEAPVIGEAEVLSDYGGYDITCEGQNDGSATATAISGGVPPYAYEWSNGALMKTVDGLSSGEYYVSIFDSQGCVDVDTIDLRAPAPIDLNLVFSAPLCFGYTDGSISVEVINGGVAPFQYSLNGAAFQASNSFSNLGAGVFEIEVMDANGCTQRDIAIINTPVPLIVDLGEDQTIDLGDSTQLNAVFNIPLEALDSIIWEDEICENCTDPYVSPVITSSYAINITNINGCSGVDDIRIFVRKDRSIYFPSAFSPNSDGSNDLYFPYAGPGVKRVLQMQIFDRWGELVFQQNDFQPDDPAFGWNGIFRGEILNPAVFVYWAKVEFIDGAVELFKGDITLVR